MTNTAWTRDSTGSVCCSVSAGLSCCSFYAMALSPDNLVTRIDDPGRARLVKVERPAQPRDSATRASAPGARHSARPLSFHDGSPAGSSSSAATRKALSGGRTLLQRRARRAVWRWPRMAVRNHGFEWALDRHYGVYRYLFGRRVRSSAGDGLRLARTWLFRVPPDNLDCVAASRSSGRFSVARLHRQVEHCRQGRPTGTGPPDLNARAKKRHDGHRIPLFDGLLHPVRCRVGSWEI